MTETTVERLPQRDDPPTIYLTKALADLRRRRAFAVKQHEQELADFDAAIRQTERERELVSRGVLLQTIKSAEEVLEVFQPENASVGKGYDVVREAIDDLAEGPTELRQRYLGTKTYTSEEAGQKEGGRYGSSPRYGNTIFSIGLREEYRAPEGTDPLDAKELTPAQREAAILYLLALLP